MVYRTSPATQERKDAKRRHIVATAGKVFAARGYSGTTVKEIADAAEVSIGSFYFYFESKEEIFAALYDELSDRANEMVDRAVAGPDLDIVQRFSRATAASLLVHESYEELTRILIDEAVGTIPVVQRKVAEKARRSLARIEKLLAFLTEKKLIRVADIRVAALAFEGTFSKVINHWVQNGKGTRLTAAAVPLAIYNLQALGIPYQAGDVKRYVKDYFEHPPEGADVAPSSAVERK